MAVDYSMPGKRVIIEKTAEGFEPGDVVTVEWTYDPMKSS